MDDRQPPNHEAQQRQEDHAVAPAKAIASLCDADGQVLDLLLDARRKGADTGPMPAGSGERVARMKVVLTLLDRMGDGCGSESHTGDETDLPRRTMERARAARQRDRFTQQVRMLNETQPGRGMGLRWRDALTAAAILIIGVSLLMPALKQTHIQSIRQACLANLGAAGQAIAAYAGDHNGALPRRTVTPGTVWWDTGNPAHSNSAQLYVLVRNGYISPDRLACPGNADAPVGRMTRADGDWPSERAVSYSYQNQFTANPIHISQAPDMAVLADKNPLIIIRTGQPMLDMQLPHDMASRTHGGRGQNVLKINGSVTWMIRPTTRRPKYAGEDNIWLMQGVTHYDGTEAPKDDDSFLVP